MHEEGSLFSFDLSMAGNGRIPLRFGAYTMRMRSTWKPFSRYLWPRLMGETNIPSVACEQLVFGDDD
jgi:hypothetical protein